MLIFLVAVVQATISTEDKVAVQLDRATDLQTKDQEVVVQQVQSSATTTKVLLEQVRTQHLPIQIQIQITR